MSFKTILVHLDNTDRCAFRVAFAAGLARVHGSHVIGLLPTGLYEGIIPADAIETGMSDFIAESADYLRRRAEGIAEGFRSRMSGPDALSFELRQVDGLAVDALVAHGRTSDLVVLGQEGGPGRTDTPSRGLVAAVMLELGRPVLVVPYAGRFDAPPRHALVAWNGSRESAVAIRCALPLLAKAGKVTLIALQRPNAPEHERRLLLGETTRWLERHGIRASTEQDASEIDMSEALLSRIPDLGTDLLVMGGYGHSRLRELVLGGLTRNILAHMTVPVLMAH